MRLISKTNFFKFFYNFYFTNVLFQYRLILVMVQLVLDQVSMDGPSH